MVYALAGSMTQDSFDTALIIHSGALQLGSLDLKSGLIDSEDRKNLVTLRWKIQQLSFGPVLVDMYGTVRKLRHTFEGGGSTAV